MCGTGRPSNRQLLSRLGRAGHSLCGGQEGSVRNALRPHRRTPYEEVATPGRALLTAPHQAATCSITRRGNCVRTDLVCLSPLTHTLCAALFYDKPSLPDVLLVTPLSGKFKITHDQVSVSGCKLTALSSKHEKNYFRIRVRPCGRLFASQCSRHRQIRGTRLASASAALPEHIEGYSNPIVCISKPTVSNLKTTVDASATVSRKTGREEEDDDDADDDAFGGAASARKRRAPPTPRLTDAVLSWRCCCFSPF